MAASGSLRRQVGLGGAVLLGLGSILGTGVFVSLGLAVGVAGEWALGALGIATFLAAMNALSSAQLAANHPVSGGTYAYGYRYLRPELGFVAGVAFLLAKSASAAAAAIGLVGYLIAWAGWQGVPLNVLAAGVALLVTGLVASGLRRANIVNAVLVCITLGALFVLITSVVMSSGPSGGRIQSWEKLDPANLFEASALLFVAFTGYGRIATLGEEVTEPRQNIPRAIIATLGITSFLYFGVLMSGLSVLGAAGFAAETIGTAAPLQAISNALEVENLALFVSLAAVTAMAGVLLNLILGLSRVAFAMGREGDAPAILGKVRPAGEPLFATLVIGAAISLIALFGGLAMVWSFSAFTVLIYYAITNLAALQLSADESLYPRAVSWLGLAGCLGLSIWVRWEAMVIGVLLLLCGLGLRTLLKR